MLISRTLSKLEAVAKEVEGEAKTVGKNIKTKVVQLDFTKTYDAATFRRIYEQDLKSLDISVLINNVGMSGGIFVPFFDMDEQGVHNETTCNLYANVLLTHQVVKTLKRRYEEGGKRSAIFFTSAMAAVTPCAGMACYSATKIATDFLAWGLQYELARYNIDVSANRAAGVSTKSLGNPETSIDMASPEQCVEQCFKKMTSGVHSGYWFHEIIMLVWTNLNDILPIYCAQTFFYTMFKRLSEGEATKKSEQAKKAA